MTSIVNHSHQLSLTAEPTKPTLSHKVIEYQRPGVKIANGKYGPIELIIYQKEIYALKRVQKQMINHPKKINNLKGERYILELLKGSSPFIVELQGTFQDKETLNFMFDYHPG